MAWRTVQQVLPSYTIIIYESRSVVNIEKWFLDCVEDYKKNLDNLDEPYRGMYIKNISEADFVRDDSLEVVQTAFFCLQHARAVKAHPA